MIEELRRRIEGDEFDYQVLLDSLKGYERPRDKITSLIRQDAIVRVKKGIYIFGQKYARRPFSREILANMIYGPSCVSLDYALHYHGLIPERVEAITSVTSGRGRRFSTPVGLFIYRTVPMRAYPVGVDRCTLTARFGVSTRSKRCRPSNTGICWSQTVKSPFGLSEWA